MLATVFQRHRIAIAVIAVAAGLPACGGGGGGGGGPDSSGRGLDDFEVFLRGAEGKFNIGPLAANAGTRPASMLDTVTTENHWFRMEFPFVIQANTVLSSDPLLTVFSQLNGNLTVTDGAGNHVPGIVTIGGIDAFGVDRSGEAGFPFSPSVADPAINLNARPNTLVYVADIDESYQTTAAFGFALDPTNPNIQTEVTTAQTEYDAVKLDGSIARQVTPLTALNIDLSEVNGIPIQGAWTIHINAAGATDTRQPFVTSIRAEVRDPTNPTLITGADVTTDFLVEFSEPMVPQSVGLSTELNGSPFNGNMPLPNGSQVQLPAPNTAITATLTSVPLFVPFDCAPLNRNNLKVYRLTPLISLPPLASVQILERSVTANQNLTRSSSAVDLFGNAYDGQNTLDVDGDMCLDGVGDTLNLTSPFTTGPGRAFVNIPVSPEVMYWLPANGRGLGAIDLADSNGYNTNTPGINANDRLRAGIITEFIWQNTISGVAVLGSPCDTTACVHNNYRYPVGTSYAYGPGVTPGWSDPTANGTGNPGTPVPGVNEMTSGFETLCRDSNGATVLTGAAFGEVGSTEDLVVGEFLDTIYFDTQNPSADSAFHLTIFGGNVPALGRNSLSDPPVPNPPPTRYWVGLPQLDVLLDQADLRNPAFLIEGEEVFTGSRPIIMAPLANPLGYMGVLSNPIRFDAPDRSYTPAFAVGPARQSGTIAYTFSARQQIGNFLYVTDRENRLVHAINSNNMRVLSSIPLPDPTGLAMSPAGDVCYVTNSSNDFVSIIATNPLGDDFNQEIGRIAVGSGPRSISVQPDNEDIFVANFIGNSISVVDVQSLTVRKELTALLNKPFDVALTPRQGIAGGPNPFGWGAGIYFGYVSNFGGNNLLVFESGPDGPQGIGNDNILGELPSGAEDPPLLNPRGLCASPLAAPGGQLAGGAFLAHVNDDGEGEVSHVQFTEQAIFGPLNINPPPGFFIPPGFLNRVFRRTGAWGVDETNRLVGRIPSDVSVIDFGERGYHENSAAPNFAGPPLVPPAPDRTGFTNSRSPVRLVPGGAIPTWIPDRLYIAFADTDTVQVVDPNNGGVTLNIIEGTGTGGIKKLASYFDQ